jgi:hypothetical protein
MNEKAVQKPAQPKPPHPDFSITHTISFIVRYFQTGFGKFLRFGVVFCDFLDVSARISKNCHANAFYPL